MPERRHRAGADSAVLADPVEAPAGLGVVRAVDPVDLRVRREVPVDRDRDGDAGAAS